MKRRPSLIPPGRALGMLGGGQLGRMAILAGRRLGYRFHVYEPSGGCAMAVAEKTYMSPWNDGRALREFAGGIEAATLEFENVPGAAARLLAKKIPVRPGAKVLEICQHRRKEKEFLRKNDFPCTEFAVVNSAQTLAKAAGAMGFPCVLKTAAFGYDGKGQVKIVGAPKDGEAGWAKIWKSLRATEGVLEKWVKFQVECSVIVARGQDGKTTTFPMAENEHRNHILHQSVAPARLPEKVQRDGAELAQAIAAKLGVVGLLAVELFYTGKKLLVNELAPRPHNSGHYTLDACLTSQFEQQIRCTAGLPQGATDLLRPAVMVNLLGDLWKNGRTPDWAELVRDPRVKLHLYDKGEPRPGRKMGHFTVLDEDVSRAVKLAEKLFRQLERG